MERDNVGSAILIIRGDNTLSAGLEVSTAMALIGAVDDATMGAELKFREEHGATVLVVDTLIVSKEDGALVVWENELGHGDNNGKSQFAGNKFIKTDHICIVIGIFKDIPISTKKASVTTAIGHNNGFMG